MTLSGWLEQQQRAYNLATFQLPYVASVKKVRGPNFKFTDEQVNLAIKVRNKQMEEGARSGRS
tara:strand:- start:9572 stop:9760 length:189 start_codon:yes stop_codon:yes gene_type:complete